jgi:hypothetical protein
VTEWHRRGHEALDALITLAKGRLMFARRFAWLGLVVCIAACKTRSADVEPYVIDGAFTGWSADGGKARDEWSAITPLTGRFTYMYLDARNVNGSNYLYFLNDWHLNQTGAIDRRCYNRFDFFNQKTLEAVTIKVFGDKTIKVFNTGKDVTQDALGAAGFFASPNVAAAHSIFEFRVPLLPDGHYAVSACDPSGPTPPSNNAACEDPAYLIDEPVMIALSIANGAITTDPMPDDAMLVYALDKYDVSPGDSVVASGRNLGASGAVTLDWDGAMGQPAVVLSWSPTRVTFKVPSGLNGNVETHFSQSTRSVSGPSMSVVCVPHCGTSCDDGCGGRCECPAGQTCNLLTNACCAPKCAPGSCDDDGCGGACACSVSQTCDATTKRCVDPSNDGGTLPH